MRELQNQFQQQREVQEQVDQLETAVKQVLTPEALARYGTLKLVHPEKAMTVLAALAQLVNAGQIKGKVTDAEFKEILRRLEPAKKEFTIKRM
ncbi:MAG: DNA-binding protein [Nanoarchaeota archaeon]|nr:DNA-binding protein [Nanoarchaeota archaeon]